MVNKKIECKDCKRAKEEMGKHRIKYCRQCLMLPNEVPKQILVKIKEE